jgi:hypothetical protein
VQAYPAQAFETEDNRMRTLEHQAKIRTDFFCIAEHSAPCAVVDFHETALFQWLLNLSADAFVDKTGFDECILVKAIAAVNHDRNARGLHCDWIKRAEF